MQLCLSPPFECFSKQEPINNQLTINSGLLQVSVKDDRSLGEAFVWSPLDCIPKIKLDETQESLANALRALLHNQGSMQQQSLMIDSMILESDNPNHVQFQNEERVRLTNNKVPIPSVI